MNTEGAWRQVTLGTWETLTDEEVFSRLVTCYLCPNDPITILRQIPLEMDWLIGEITAQEEEK